MFQVYKINYNLRHFQKLQISKKSSVQMGLETISYRAPELWNFFPTEIKAIDIQGENKVMGL